jgi:hypothetical protein
MNNYGRFSISSELIRRNPKAVIDAFNKLGLLVVRAEMLYAEQAIEYTAYCESFEHVPEGTIIPEYIIRITTDNDIFSLVEYGLIGDCLEWRR